MTSHKGFTLIEMLVSIVTLGIVAMALADFSSDMFKVSYDHSVQIKNASQTRLSAETITNQINNAVYIFPADHDITLSGEGNSSVTINTSNSIAFLIRGYTESATPSYIFKAFYLDKDSNGESNLYEFTRMTEKSWPKNTLPYDYFASNTGYFSLIATDIDETKSSLSYVLNYNNGISDGILRGSMSNTNQNDQYALIRGINWRLSIKNNVEYELNIGGISKSVPRFIE